MINQNFTIAVSILTANFLNLKDELDRIIAAKIPAIHFDVMDNNFVSNLSFGPKILNDINNYLEDKNVVIDCHLMVKIKSNIKIKDFLKPFIMNKVNSITLHYEALNKKQLSEFINWKNSGFKKGLALNPETKVNMIFNHLEKLDLVLIMSVNPGFGKQKFIFDSYEKIKILNDYWKIKTIKKPLIIAVDGGINDKTASNCIKFGANYLVAGSYLLNSNNSIQDQLAKLKK